MLFESEFDGSEFAREKTPLLLGESASLAALSDDQSCFVKIQSDGTLHRWSLDGDRDSESRLDYRYQGSTTIDDFSKEDLPFLAMLPKLERIRVPYTAFPPHVAIPKVHFPLLAKISSLRSLDLAISTRNVDDLELMADSVAAKKTKTA